MSCAEPARAACQRARGMPRPAKALGKQHNPLPHPLGTDYDTDFRGGPNSRSRAVRAGSGST